VSSTMRRFLAWLPMAGMVVLGVRAALVWDELPAVMASHFGANGVANGWMPRNQFFIASFACTVPVAALLAVIAERIGRRKPLAGVGMLTMEWLTSALLIGVFWSAIDANLYHQRLAVFPVWIIIAAMIPVVLAVGIDWKWWLRRRPYQPKSGRHGAPARDRLTEAVGPTHSAAEQFGAREGHHEMVGPEIAAPERVVAEERHGSGRAAIGMLALGAGVMALVMLVPPHFVAIPVVLMVVIGLSALWAWRGFDYRFTTAAVEIRTFGIRLRRIPLLEIKEFNAEEVHPLTDFGGWGIKGFGSDTAYIWGGHTALHIKTYQGDVYLGHRDPERLGRDMEMVMKPVRSA